MWATFGSLDTGPSMILTEEHCDLILNLWFFTQSLSRSESKQILIFRKLLNILLNMAVDVMAKLSKWWQSSVLWKLEIKVEGPFVWIYVKIVGCISHVGSSPKVFFLVLKRCHGVHGEVSGDRKIWHSYTSDGWTRFCWFSQFASMLMTWRAGMGFPLFFLTTICV